MERLIALAKKVNQKIDTKSSPEVQVDQRQEEIPKKQKKSKKKRSIEKEADHREEGNEEKENGSDTKRVRVEDDEGETRNDYPYLVNSDDHCETKADA
jgi:hypothetical protein